MILKRYLLTGAALLFLVNGFAIAKNNSGFAFLKIGVDARATAMAGAYTALTNDASATFWNPAGLALAKNQSIIVMHNNWLWDLEHSYAAYQFLTGDHNFAVAFNYILIPGIEIRGSQPSEESYGSVDAYNLSAGISYATSYDEKWTLGLTLKYLFEKYYLTSAPGWALDLGIHRKEFLEFTDFGFTIRNIGKMSHLKNESSILPIIISSDFSLKVPRFFDEKLFISPGIRWIENESTYFHIGAEYQLYESLYLRGGFKSEESGTPWSGGFGINYESFHLDYSYAPFEYFLGTSNRISLGLTF